MSDRLKNIVLSVMFISILVIFFVANILKPETEISISERRKLAKFPKLTMGKVLDGSFSKDFDKYTTDQIIYRDEFRKLKSIVEFDLLCKKDNNNMYMYEGSIIKIESPLNEKSVLNVANKINTIQEKYLSGSKVYYSIIPDKNYFTKKKEYIRMDYEELENIMKENVKNSEYISIFEDLKLSDYYLTDIHWKQENLQKVVEKISTKMNFNDRLKKSYIKETVIDFEGIYAGQLPLKTEKDTITILKNDITENAIVYNYQTKEVNNVYDKNKLNSNDKYDIYLSGSTPLITIINPNAPTDKELILFRDSFGSSLAPLFIEAYSKITLVDIRYMRTKDLEDYIEFKDQDVLFLYSTLVINNSSTLK